MSEALRRDRPAPKPPHNAPLAAPGPWRVMLEARAPLELAVTLAASPLLARLPVGDGHPVLVFPGLGAGDLSTLALRRFLRDRGYSVYPWAQGLNLGPGRGALDACRVRLAELAHRHREPVSLVGWSLGGLYARELAKEQPQQVRCVVTLGTPFAGHPRATHAWRLYEWVSGESAHEHERAGRLHEPPPCPTSSIYSRSDGIVAWRCSLNPAAPLAENIEIRASHIGMGLNPLALYVIADRLAQDPRHWKRFEPARALRRLFGRAR